MSHILPTCKILTLLLFLLLPAISLAQTPSGPADFGDLPNATTPGATIFYKTTVSDGGPWHLIDSQLFIGNLVDNDSDGFPSVNADGDDTNGGTDDEDGVAIPATIQAATNATFNIKVTNQTTSLAYLHAFIDWNGDGAFVGGVESQVVTVSIGTTGVNVPVAFSVPATAETSKPIGARFRLSTLAVDPEDTAPDGEIEDYMISVAAPDMDFGDLPDSSTGASPAYATTSADNGARHVVTNDLYLGSSVPDIDTDGQPDGLAEGDDNDGGDDEDGFSPTSGLQAGTSASFTHTATNQLTSDAWLHCFIDWNHDGDFLDTSEYSKTSVSSGASGSSVAWSVSVPTGIAYTASVPARLRLTSLEIIGVDGFAPDGEVEDYLLSVSPALDYGDLPDTSVGTSAGDFITAIPDFQTTLADDGARHLVTPELVFANDTGSSDADVDFESDAIQSIDATGDDTTDDNDELDMLSVVTSLAVTSGGAADCSDVEISIEILLSHAIRNELVDDAFLYTFIDWNHDGDFLDADESWTQLVAAGTDGNVTQTVSATFGWEGLLNWTEIWAVRSRLTTDTAVAATGYASDGEVQDDLITVNLSISDPCPVIEPTMDFGDLPDSCEGSSAGSFDTGTILPDYRTRLDDNGPRHTVTSDLTIANDTGSSDLDADSEHDGQPTDTADGDDLDGNDDDLALLSVVTSQIFNSASPIDHSTITLSILTSQAVNNVTGDDATFYGFIDANRDGDFGDPGEKETVVIPGDGSVAEANVTFSLTIPWNGELNWTETFATRFRISSESSLDANGAAPDGEVQDHLISIQIAISDPRPQGSLIPNYLDRFTIVARRGESTVLDPSPYLPIGIGQISEVTWSLNGQLLVGSPPVLTVQDLQELSTGVTQLTLTFQDDQGLLYRVDPWLNLRDWPSYDIWVDIYDLEGVDSLPESDPDGDGYSNKEEFAFGSDPSDASSTPESHIDISSDGGDDWFIHSYLRREGGVSGWAGTYEADGVTYTGQSSNDLDDWTRSSVPVANPLSLPAAPSGYDWSTHRYPDPMDITLEGFLRVKTNCD